MGDKVIFGGEFSAVGVQKFVTVDTVPLVLTGDNSCSKYLSFCP